MNRDGIKRNCAPRGQNDSFAKFVRTVDRGFNFLCSVLTIFLLKRFRKICQYAAKKMPTEARRTFSEYTAVNYNVDERAGLLPPPRGNTRTEALHSQLRTGGSDRRTDPRQKQKKTAFVLSAYFVVSLAFPTPNHNSLEEIPVRLLEVQSIDPPCFSVNSIERSCHVHDLPMDFHNFPIVPLFYLNCAYRAVQFSGPRFAL